MKTADAFKIGLALGKIGRTLDAWEENKHKRAKNGQFSSTGGGGESPKSSNNKENTIKYNTSPENLVENLKKITEIKESAKPEEKKALTELQSGILKEIEKIDWEKKSSKSNAKVESGKKEMEDFVSKYGTGISVKELASKVSRHLASKGYDVTILNDKYPVIEGKNFQLVKNKSKGTWSIKEW